MGRPGRHTPVGRNRSAASSVQLFRMRVAYLVAVVALLAACGGNGSSGDSQGSPAAQKGAQLPDWVKEELGSKGGPDVAATMGSADFAVGDNRVVFLVVREDGSLVQRPTATVSYATDGDEPTTANAVLQPLGAHEHSGSEDTESHDHLDVTDVYVAHLQAPTAGRYWFVVDPKGEKIQAVGTLDVKDHSATPAVGEHAPESDNPTLADAAATDITTAHPPDKELLRYSVAESLQAGLPFVVVFATPEFCVSRVCGPTVEVVQKVAQKFSADGIRFIHVEIYTDNDPKKGFNRWVREWGLPTEPWVFVVDSSGTIRTKFEGAVSVDELELAVRAELLS
jgi:hypothetical protein